MKEAVICRAFIGVALPGMLSTRKRVLPSSVAYAARRQYRVLAGRRAAIFALAREIFYNIAIIVFC